MEKFEIDGEKKLEAFASFVDKAKSVFNVLIDNIKKNIKDYEGKIENTSKEISDNELSREKCEQEITRMETEIKGIKENIENVESTYKRIADAYSSTSKGETKELYSDVIESAKSNCDKEVEKNRNEIAKLNSDIEAIKNNISEFTNLIDDLNKDLDNYNNELFRYMKGQEYLEKISSESSTELDAISKKEAEPVKKETKTKKTEPKKTETRKTTTKLKSTTEEKKETPKKTESKKPSVLDTFEPESFETKKEEKKPVSKEKPNNNDYDFEESLRQIYELTGYTPKEEKNEEPKEQPVYTDNLENLFATPTNDVVEKSTEPEETSFLDADFTNWENMLDSSIGVKEEPKKEEPVKSIDNELDNTADQLLVPYGTSVARLKSLVGSEIVYKNGEKVPFELSNQDVIKAVNLVDGNDLKKMKTVGPEITLLRKIKEMKEGNLQ